jgi:hypothetical protein
MDYVLDTQYPDGWIGSETGDQWQPRFLWGRYPFLFGGIMLVEADPSYTDRVCCPNFSYHRNTHDNYFIVCDSIPQICGTVESDAEKR